MKNTFEIIRQIVCQSFLSSTCHGHVHETSTVFLSPMEGQHSWHGTPIALT